MAALPSLPHAASTESLLEDCTGSLFPPLSALAAASSHEGGNLGAGGRDGRPERRNAREFPAPRAREMCLDRYLSTLYADH